MSYIVIEGNTTDAAELRYTPNGKAVTDVTVIVNERVKNEDDEWVDGAATSYRVTVWGKPAEAFAEQVTKSQGLVVTGELTIGEYTDRDNNRRTSRDINADKVGKSIRFMPKTA